MSLHYTSRRSAVYATRGMVASSQPLATQVGLRILMDGGNAADASIATAAALNLTEPGSTGIGGDMFVLYYEAATRTVHALNGSGRAPAALDIDLVEKQGLAQADHFRDPIHAHCITVPGAIAGWFDLAKRFGSMPMAHVLAPVIDMAERGYPVAPLMAAQWKGAFERGMIHRAPHLLPNGKPPVEGQLFKNPNFARTLRTLAEGGRDAYYTGDLARRIVEAVQSNGGTMTGADLAAHTSTWDTPISTTYRGVRVWECPPNGQGLAALMALNILEGYAPEELALGDWQPDSSSTPHNLTARTHKIIEALRLAFADTRWFVADPATNPAPLNGLLSKTYAAQRRALINPARATVDQKRGQPVAGSDTVYFSVVDGAGNAASFIISNYMGFGTGIAPRDAGFTLQNRGYGFSLDRAHPNALAPGKRPYHTIIPAMLTRDAVLDDVTSPQTLVAPFGVMGGFNQPQGHALVAMNLIDDALDPQAALDRPRLSLEAGSPDSKIAIEDGVPADVIASLKKMGHDIYPVSGAARGIVGRGQIITRREDGVLCGGSDPRADGCALGWA